MNTKLLLKQYIVTNLYLRLRKLYSWLKFLNNIFSFKKIREYTTSHLKKSKLDRKINADNFLHYHLSLKLKNLLLNGH